jgi:hypothetical protein
VFGAARASRFESAAAVVARRGKYASALSSSVRRLGIADARSWDVTSSRRRRQRNPVQDRSGPATVTRTFVP